MTDMETTTAEAMVKQGKKEIEEEAKRPDEDERPEQDDESASEENPNEESTLGGGPML